MGNWTSFLIKFFDWHQFAKVAHLIVFPNANSSIFPYKKKPGFPAFSNKEIKFSYPQWKYFSTISISFSLLFSSSWRRFWSLYFLSSDAKPSITDCGNTLYLV